jgi:hypothetical protein
MDTLPPHLWHDIFDLVPRTPILPFVAWLHGCQHTLDVLPSRIVGIKAWKPNKRFGFLASVKFKLSLSVHRLTWLVASEPNQREPCSLDRGAALDIVNGNLLLWAVHHAHMPTLLWQKGWQFRFTKVWAEPGMLPFKVCIRRFMHTASVNGSVAVLQFLQQWGIEQQGDDLNIDWVTMTTNACALGHVNVLQFVKDNKVLGYPWPLIKRASDQRQIGAMRFFKAWADEQSWDIMTTIHEEEILRRAVEDDNEPVLQLLREWGITHLQALRSLRNYQTHRLTASKLYMVRRITQIWTCP